MDFAKTGPINHITDINRKKNFLMSFRQKES